MRHRFIQRGYDKGQLDQAMAKVNSLERSTLLTKTPRTQQPPKTFFSSQYGHLGYDIRRAISRNWSILQSDPALATVFSEPPSFAFRRAPTLRDSLVRSHLPPPLKPTWLPRPSGTFRCGSCKQCDNIDKSNTFADATGNKTLHCKSYANCNTTYVVYRLECVCGCFYIGRTKRRLRDRLAEHKYAIKTQNPNYPMAVHCKSPGHSNPNSLRAMVVEVVQSHARGGDRLKRLLQRETFWIDKLRATSAPGLNEEIDFSPFL